MMFTTDSRRSYSSVDGVAKSQEGAAVSLYPCRRARSEGGVSLQDSLRLIDGWVENLGRGDGEHHQEEKSHLREKVALVLSRLNNICMTIFIILIKKFPYFRVDLLKC